MSELHQVSVFIESTNEYVVMNLSAEQLSQAQQDSGSLQELVNQHYEDLARAVQDTGTQSEFQPGASQSEASQPEASQPEEQMRQNIHELDSDDTRDENPKSQYIWSDACIFLLLTIFEENKENLSRQRHRKVYNDIASKMRQYNDDYKMTGGQCQSKINSLKKTYKKIKDHNSKSGNDNATWPYYTRMDELFGAAGWAHPVAVASEAGPPAASTSSSSEAGPAPSGTNQGRKRKLESLLENLIDDKKKDRLERQRIKQQNIDKLLDLKKKQHEEKMEVLKLLLNNGH